MLQKHPGSLAINHNDTIHITRLQDVIVEITPSDFPSVPGGIIIQQGSPSEHQEKEGSSGDHLVLFFLFTSSAAGASTGFLLVRILQMLKWGFFF
jgi:hypothetical protein